MITNEPNRLELMLRWWEHICWSRSFAWRYEEVAGQEHTLDFGGGLEKFGRIRQDMMNIRPFENVDALADSYELPPLVRLEFGTTSRIPHFLFNWTSQSRRIYSISREVAALMMTSKFKTMRWRDIKWPFKSFAIKFAKPVLQEEEFDFLVVNVSDSIVEVLLLSRQLDSFSFVPTTKRDRIERLFQQRRLFDAANTLNQLKTSDNKPVPPFATAAVRIESPDQLVSEALEMTFRESEKLTGSLRKMAAQFLEQEDTPSHLQRLTTKVQKRLSYKSAEARERLEVLIHLPIALSVYLTALSYGRSNVVTSGWERKSKPKGSRGRTISDTAQVCSVESTIRFSEEELEAIERCRTQAEREIGTHFRSFHMRRPPGKGHIDEHPKTVPVRETIVNEGKTPPGELPVGATTEVK